MKNLPLFIGAELLAPGNNFFKIDLFAIYSCRRSPHPGLHFGFMGEESQAKVMIDQGVLQTDFDSFIPQSIDLGQGIKTDKIFIRFVYLIELKRDSVSFGQGKCLCTPPVVEVVEDVGKLYGIEWTLHNRQPL